MELAQYADALQSVGVIGAVMLALVGGLRKWWVWYWVYQDLQKRLDKKDQQYDDLLKLMQEKFLPALTQATDVIQDILLEKRRN